MVNLIFMKLLINNYNVKFVHRNIINCIQSNVNKYLLKGVFIKLIPLNISIRIILNHKKTKILKYQQKEKYLKIYKSNRIKLEKLFKFLNFDLFINQN